MILITGLIVLVTPGAVLGQPVPPEVTLEGSQMHQFQVKSGEEYNLYVTIPLGYRPDGNIRYPVLYVLDAGGHFLMIAQTYRLLQLGNELPPIILVGVDKPASSLRDKLARRFLDLTPTKVPDREQRLSQRYGQPVITGGADAFLSVLREEIMPWVESQFPTSNEKGLVGFSFGGLYATHVLLTAPDAFSHYLIGSPSLWWDNEVLFERERAYSKEFTDLSARVFISVGTLEGGNKMMPNVVRMADSLSNRNYENLQLKHHIFEDETHLSVIPATYSRGLRFLFGRQ